MKVLITGGFGNVGRSAVAACLSKAYDVTIFESPNALNSMKRDLKSLARRRWNKCHYAYGDIRSKNDIAKALKSIEGGPDAIIHLAGLIPPAVDMDQKRAWDINVGGTKNILEVCSELSISPRIVFASSIATYGDRLRDFWIGTDDPLSPTDFYAKTKIECEKTLVESGFDFAILRLTFVAWSKWLLLDPLLFSMPLDTHIEIIHTEDAGRAFAEAAANPQASRSKFDIGGGVGCRTSFRAYLDRMFRYFGLGDSEFLPEEAFAKNNFHCGWYKDSDQAENILHFRRKNLEDYYEEVRWQTRFVRPFASFVSPFAKRWILAKSPYLGKEERAPHTRFKKQVPEQAG
jgi:nucleoside-diphosphate-sugar epimerase